MSHDPVAQHILPQALVEVATRMGLHEFLAMHGGSPTLLVRVDDPMNELAMHLSSAFSQSGQDQQRPAQALAYETVVQISQWNPAAGASGFGVSELQRILARDTYFVTSVAKRPGESAYMDRVSVGRARNKDIVLRDSSVSKFHAWFEIMGDGSITVADAGSKNGTRVNGEQLEAKQPRTLNMGDSLRFGGVETRLCAPELVWRVLNPGK